MTGAHGLPENCPACLLSLGLSDADDTELRPFEAGAHEPESFTPGTVVAERFRIIARVGRGGMGEVYRADDLKLGHAVALKFLPRDRKASDELVRLTYSEVRVGREIAHPNVCRLYDVVEVDDSPVIVMELVDGEDLASLLTRVGRLSYEKSREVARDVCAGLDAAHELGIAHGDLKPANVMIDGRGRARITDFGLSHRIGAAAPGRVAGTPAYMAPELFAGGGASRATDIYSLGMLLGDLFKSPPPPLDDIILRCLDHDPAQRPSSVRALMAALPGGDALEEMVAAGETPSPEYVAANDRAMRLAPPVAWGIAAAALALLVLLAAVSQRLTLYGRLAPAKAPEALAERARQLAGIEHAADEAYWFEPDDGRSIVFRYRSSPRPMAPSLGRVTLNDPPFDERGMHRVALTPRGEPLSVEAAPQLAPASAAGDRRRLPHVVYILLIAGLLAVGAYLARRNFRAGRVDRVGAMRVAMWVFVCGALGRIVDGHHPLVIEKEALFFSVAVGGALRLAAEVWLMYVALEPYVRRQWPQAMVSWTRLVRGRFLDPLIGRDLLLGALGGIVMRLLDQLRNVAALHWPQFGAMPSHLAVPSLTSMNRALGNIFHSGASSVYYAFAALFLLVLLRMALRRPSLAAVVWIVAATTAWSRWNDLRLDIPLVAAQMIVIVVALHRLGLLAAAVALFVHLAAMLLPLTLDLSAFYFPQSALALGVLGGLVAWGVRACNESPRLLHQ